jgi:hypothetical protein
MYVLSPISKNPINHIKCSVISCIDTALYVVGSDSVYLDKAITYNNKRMIIQPLLISPTNPVNTFIIMSLADETRDLAAVYPINTPNGTQFITPTRLNITRWDAVSCDFCSICNGFLHWLDHALDSDPTYTTTIGPRKQ